MRRTDIFWDLRDRSRSVRGGAKVRKADTVWAAKTAGSCIAVVLLVLVLFVDVLPVHARQWLSLLSLLTGLLLMHRVIVGFHGRPWLDEGGVRIKGRLRGEHVLLLGAAFVTIPAFVAMLSHRF